MRIIEINCSSEYKEIEHYIRASTNITCDYYSPVDLKQTSDCSFALLL